MGCLLRLIQRFFLSWILGKALNWFGNRRSRRSGRME